MHGRECERRIRRRHMLSAPIHSAAITPDSFNKDGRNVRVGDCALFKPPDSSPPLIGIIHSLFPNKEENLSLCVNWIYRPADVKLGKGTSLEAAPNEVFYVFQKDEIPVASLLHPCKVAFLHKGVELPTGTSSFVCRRVYDTENNCLRWLTDQDYIKEHQEEVDKLLDRTRIEMHGALPSGSSSPKPLNGPHIKPSADSVYSSASPLVSLVKGKKRDRSDQSSDHIKRERISRADDAYSDQFRPEQHLKFEISKITEKGGLVDIEGVEKFVQLMQPDSSEKKIDLACRIMLVGVIAVTDRFDCLGQFVQLRGLPILDEWLQEVHKGKIGDGRITKENDKSVVDFLLTSLRALDKLPVNLHALQSCNVGKSVNNLRTHKNSEIHKKARNLVDTWKKRVEAEMNIIDSKSGSSRGFSWSAKTVLSEVSHVGNRRPGGSSEVVMKGKCAQSAAGEIQPVKLGSSDAVAKFIPASPRSAKPSAPNYTSGAASSEDLNPVINVGVGPSDPSMPTIKQEKSSSSSHSQNNSQPCSSDHAKAGGSFREDARSSTAGSVGVNKISTGASRHRKPNNGVHGSANSGVQTESFLGKFSSLNRNLVPEKDPPTRATYERTQDVPSMDHGGNQRLTVEVTDSGRSTPRSTNGGLFENSVGKYCKISSPPSHLEKLDHVGHKTQGKTDALPAGSASNENTDVYHCQEGCAGSKEGNISSAPQGKTAGEDWKKLTEPSTVSGPSPGTKMKSVKSYEASYSSMNALIESCARISEASAFATAGDDMGMNLLAAVAAGEMPSSYVSPGSPRENSTALEDSCSGNDGKSGNVDGDIAQSKDQHNDGADRDAPLEQVNSFDALRVKDDPQLHPTPVAMNLSNEVKVTSSDCGEKAAEENGHDQGLSSDRNHGDVIPDTSAVLPSVDATKEGNAKAAGNTLFDDPRKSGDSQLRSNSILDSKIKVRSTLFDEDKTVDFADVAISNNSVIIGAIVHTSGKGANGELSSCSLSETFRDTKDTVHEESDDAIADEPQRAIAANIPSELTRESDEDAALSFTSGAVLCMEPKTEKAGEIIDGHKENNEKLKVALGTSILDQNGSCADKSEKEEDLNHSPGGSDPCEENLGKSTRQVDWRIKLNRCKLDGSKTYGKEEPASSINASSSLAAGLNIAVKLDFDLNEGCSVDDGGQAELANSSIPGCSPTIHLPCTSQLPISSILGSVPASITVAAAAKGPFFPPENPLRSKGEIGWKGSAATSAFRPAEPRKVLEMPLGTTDFPFVSNSMSKQARHPLDIDLNVPDQRVYEDVVSQSPVQVKCLESGPCDGSGGRLDFDLNRVDESPDIAQLSVSSSCRLEIPQLLGRSPLSTGLYKSGLNALRNFDLNNGPGLDEAGTDTVLHAKGNVPILSALPGVRMNCGELGNLSSWFPSSNTYSTIPLPSILAGRGESYPFVTTAGSHRLLGPGTSGNYFGSEIYRGPVLSSSPAVALPPASPFQYSGFPFETNLYSGSSIVGAPLGFSAISPQLGGSTGAVVPPHYPRGYIMNLSSGASNIGPEIRKWGGGQALDLNSGPGGTEVEQRDERVPISMRQLPVAGSQVLADEQLKVYPMVGGLFKRKEPDGGWDGDKISYKEPSWR